MLPFCERTLVLIKPDAVKRGLIGDIIRRIESAGLAIVGLKIVTPSLEFSRKHYPLTDAQLIQMGKKTLSTYSQLSIDPISELNTSDPKEIGLLVHEWNAEFLSSGPVVACAVEGVHAVKKVRSLCGATMPLEAIPGTIRGDYSSASPAIANMQKTAVFNLVHASDNNNDPNEPANEIAHWFKEEELVNYKPVATIAMFK